MIQTQLVIHPGGNQSDDQSKCVNDDGKASRFTSQEFLYLSPFEFGNVISVQDRNGANYSQQIEDQMQRLRKWRIQFNKCSNFHGSFRQNENHNELPECQTCQKSVTENPNGTKYSLKIQTQIQWRF